jgi:hypothetical protein
MIQNTRTAYWSVGITVQWRERSGSNNGQPHGGWGASLEFLDDGFCNDDADTGRVSTQGTLNTRYFVADGERASGLSAAVDALIADAQRLGIEFTNRSLYYKGDGEDPEFPPPDGWEAQLVAEAARIGWSSYGADQ